jgi:hypothetical protein
VGSLAEKDMNSMQSHLRIVSALYGLLKPCDAIQKYRMCFDYKVLPLSSMCVSYCIVSTVSSCVQALPILTLSALLCEDRTYNPHG